MGKYKVVTDKGTYIVETEEVAQPSDATNEPGLLESGVNAIGRMVSEGGPSAIGAATGAALGAVAGPPGIAAGGALGGMAGELGRQLWRKYVGGGPAPQSNSEAVGLQLTAGLGGGLGPGLAAAKYPLAAQAGRYGANHCE
jgi:hypothetical protein